MFKKITLINNTYALVKIDNIITDDLLNLNVVIEENNIKILGEIVEINNDEIRVNFLGEFINNTLYNSISKMPSINASVRIINNNELATITNYYEDKAMLLGFLPKYNNSPIKVSVDKLWNYNFALIGESNTGKTNASIEIIKNLFLMSDFIPFNSIIFIINNNRDYYNRLSSISDININFNYKMYTTNNNEKNNLFKIPLWFMDVDDYASILNVTSTFQKSLINKLIKCASIIGKRNEESENYKNYLLSNTILKIINSYEDKEIINKITSILSNCSTDKINLNIKLPHTDDNLFDFDNGYLDKNIIIEYLSSFNNKYNIDNTLKYFNINDLIVAINYVLIDSEIYENNDLYQEALELKNKLNDFINSNIKNYFLMDNYLNINQYISNTLLINNNRKAQIINLIMENIDIEISRKLINIYLKILLNFVDNLPNNKKIPIHIIIDDIKDFITNNDMINKIIKDDNKKIFIDFITDNFNKLGEDTLEYYDNLLLFRSSKNNIDVDNNLFDRQRLLKNDTCIAMGKMVYFPMVIRFNRLETDNLIINNEIFDKWMIMWKNR